jgi:DeoR/GlpR family transcriptional regulator of sugar metabolism
MSDNLSNNGQFDMNLNRLQAGRKAKLDSRLDRLLDIYHTNPSLGISNSARLLNVSRQTIYSYLEQLENAGKIRRTDQGIEVLE